MTRRYIVQYKCGCSVGPAPRNAILDYCGTHGDDVKVKYPMLTKRERKSETDIARRVAQLLDADTTPEGR